MRAGEQIVRGFSSRRRALGGIPSDAQTADLYERLGIAGAPQCGASLAGGEDGMGTEAVCKIMPGTGR